ncbi:hypothetical protein CWC33_11210 [Idiomarina sp. X4]|uniref:putative bifunctional diguanylate cyclase/phosphodiesterase n=1 Tax=Idiomarina sp. X4 TaxID=2055892 RepID=UPI000C286903|nr:EAL domain-containing protein [Idiomarina sp. X4]ATZ74229.1 hypothetical protein CWC33_11210 [Idiomarina sp. X4]
MNDVLMNFFDLGQYAQAPLPGNYNHWLVVLSYLVAFIASFTALKIFERAHRHRSVSQQKTWTLITAIVAGIGVWSMHFIGMIAFQLPVMVSHSVGLTLASIVPAVIGNYYAYSLHLSEDRLANFKKARARFSLKTNILSGIILGAGIGLMHYMGMEAMQLNAELLYSPVWFAASILIAVVLGIFATSTYSRSSTIRGAKNELRKIQFVTALIIAAAISGMHYAAMLAARFYPTASTEILPIGSQHQHLWLIYAIVVAVTLIALISWVSSVIDKRFQHNYRAIKQSDKRIRELAFNDTLTGLPNRRSLLDYLSQQQQETPENEHLVLFLLDIDKFKVLNNTLGPTLGDLLLQSVTHRLERVALNVHMVARPSSNEFAVVARVQKSNNPVQAQSHALSMAKTLQQELQAPYSLKDYRHQCSMSFGVTVVDSFKKSSEDILVQAALALAEAKRNGMGEIRLYHPEMADAIEKRVKLEAELRQAIETRDGLELYLQPQLDTNRQVIGAEALIRWHHSERGMVSPAEFIPLAEETGLIIGLGDLINEQACQIIRQWQQLGLTDLVLSINVSAPQFQQMDFVDKLNSLLKQYEVPAGQLKLELTESVLMQNLDDVIHKIKELKQLGIQFALDDFGTGYSSLSYLMKLPFDVLKIDVSFVRDMFQSEQKEAIVQTIVQLAHNLGLKVVAEGVETEKHFDYLSSLGCDYFQGYLFSKPVAEPDFRKHSKHFK